MKKKITFVIPTLKGGGAERVTINILRAINKDLFDVTLIVINKEGSYVELLPNNIKVIDLKTKRVRYALLKLIKAINTSNPDIVFSTLGYMNLSLLSIKRFLKNKPNVIVRQANTLSKSVFSKSTLKRKIIYSLYKSRYKKADLIIAQCNEMKRDLLDQLKIRTEKIEVVYNPIDLNTILNHSNNPTPFDHKNINYLAVGRLSHQKGFDVLLDAFSLVLKTYSNACLTILGEGDLRVPLTEQAKRLKITEKVDFKGFVENPYIYYKNTDVYVLSSRWEGFPNTLLEALACKTKVVSTDCKSGPKEILGNNQYGMLAETDSSQSLATAMINAVKEVNKSSDRAEYFDAKNIIKKYEKIFLEV